MTTLIPKFDLMNGGSTPVGAINRPINEVLSENISVKDFGAVGNGTTNDTLAIQAAINSLTIGGTINLPKGTYLVDTLFFPFGSSQINFVGSGISATILLMNNPIKPVIQLNQSSSPARTVGNLFSDFSVKVNSNCVTTNPAHICIDASGFNNSTFQRIKYLSNGTAGCYSLFNLQGDPNPSYNTYFDNITISEQVGPKYALKTGNNGTTYLNNPNVVYVTNSWIYANSDMYAAFDMSNCTQYVIEKCLIEGTGQYGIILGNNGTIKNNWFESQIIAALLFQNTESVNSASNIIEGNALPFAEHYDIPSGCNGNAFINNLGPGSLASDVNTPRTYFIGFGGQGDEPTLTQTQGSVGTLTKISSQIVSNFDGTWHLLYNFLAPSTGTYAVTLTPPSPYKIVKLVGSAYGSGVSIASIPYITCINFPNTIVQFTVTNSDLVIIDIQLTYQ